MVKDILQMDNVRLIHKNFSGVASKYNREGNRLDEESLSILDDVDMLKVDIDINPFNYDVNGKTGISAYLIGMCITQNVNRFEQRFAEEEAPEE
jgi:hypothetical protein